MFRDTLEMNVKRFIDFAIYSKKNYHMHQFKKMEQLIAENNQHTFLKGSNLNETR